MAGKRKASEAFDDAPVSSWPHPHPPWRGAGNHYEDENEDSLSDSSDSEDSRSDSTYMSDGDHAGGEYSSEESQIADSSEESQIADIFAYLKLGPLSHVPSEAEMQAPPPADQPAAALVADQSFPAAAPAAEMVVPAAESVPCLGCGREPALVRLVPVKHACLCLPCRSSPSGRPRCEFCDGPR